MKKGRICGIVRKISQSLANCELLHLARGRIDVALAQKQHDQYVDGLRQWHFINLLPVCVIHRHTNMLL